jgi:histidinol phosphatase-like PHP family hydrolase
VEAFYAYGNPKPWTSRPKQTEQILSLGKIYGLFKTCGTDTHGLSLLLRIEFKKYKAKKKKEKLSLLTLASHY